MSEREQLKLLAITHTYRSFQKESIEATSLFFRDITTLVRVNPLVEFSKYIPIGNFSQHRIDYKIDNTDIPNNCHFFLTPVIYVPFEFQYRNLGQRHLNSVKKTINDKKVQFDIIHAHFAWSAGYVGAKLRNEFKKPFVVTVHGYDIYELPFKSDFWNEKIRYVLTSADHVITVSESNKKCIDKLEIDTPISIIPNGYPSNLFYPRDSALCREKLNLPLNKKIILTAGSFVKEKGQIYLISAVEEILKSRDDVLCLIIGSGPLEKQLKKEVDRLNLQKHIIFPGPKSHKDIADWMNACDVFVLSSIRESFGVVQIEAMACGKPVVATKNGGSEEIIISENFGYLVDSCDAKKLAEKIVKSLEKKWDSEYIISYAKKFSWETVSKEIINIYEKCLG